MPRIRSQSQALHRQRQVRMAHTRSGASGAGAAQVSAGDGATESTTGIGAAKPTAGEDATYSITESGAV